MDYGPLVELQLEFTSFQNCTQHGRQALIFKGQAGEENTVLVLDDASTKKVLYYFFIFGSVQ